MVPSLSQMHPGHTFPMSPRSILVPSPATGVAGVARFFTVVTHTNEVPSWGECPVMSDRTTDMCADSEWENEYVYKVTVRITSHCSKSTSQGCIQNSAILLSVSLCYVAYRGVYRSFVYLLIWSHKIAPGYNAQFLWIVTRLSNK
jgi:hypothetical protein